MYNISIFVFIKQQLTINKIYFIIIFFQSSNVVLKLHCCWAPKWKTHVGMSFGE